MNGKILIIEDDPEIQNLVEHVMLKNGFKVSMTDQGEEGLIIVEEETPDLIILDWMLPDLAVIEVCRRLRRNQEYSDIPVIMITGRGDEADRIRGLETGADDYITKPFSMNELAARVKAVLRRSRPALSGQLMKYEDIELDSQTHKVSRGGEAVHLGPTEFRLLRHFMEYPGRVYSREQLLDSVWGHDVYVEVRTVDVHIRRLRKALNEGNLPNYIRTVRSAGYSLDSSAAKG